MDVKFKEVIEDVRVPDLDKGGTKLVQKAILKIEKSFGIDLASSVEKTATEEDKILHAAQYQVFLADKQASADPVGALKLKIKELQDQEAAMAKAKEASVARAAAKKAAAKGKEK